MRDGARHARRRGGGRIGAMLVLLALCLAGCTSMGRDPFEATNRTVFAFNRHVNDTATLPVAWVYVNYVPLRLRRGLRNVLANAESPVTLVNDLLQGEFAHGAQTLSRFMLNSTLGLGGLLDLGAQAGVHRMKPISARRWRFMACRRGHT